MCHDAAGFADKASALDVGGLTSIHIVDSAIHVMRDHVAKLVESGL